MRAHALQQFEAVHLRHDHVAQDQIDLDFDEVLDALAAISDREASVSLGFEKGGDDFANGFFVVHDQDAPLAH